jgi:hypothetical protein
MERRRSAAGAAAAHHYGPSRAPSYSWSALRPPTLVPAAACHPLRAPLTSASTPPRESTSTRRETLPWSVAGHWSRGGKPLLTLSEAGKDRIGAETAGERRCPPSAPPPALPLASGGAPGDAQAAGEPGGEGELVGQAAGGGARSEGRAAAIARMPPALPPPCYRAAWTPACWMRCVWERCCHEREAAAWGEGR